MGVWDVGVPVGPCIRADHPSNEDFMAVFHGTPVGGYPAGLEHLAIDIQGAHDRTRELEGHRLSVVPAAEVHDLSDGLSEG